jgi:hypothetical protein
LVLATNGASRTQASRPFSRPNEDYGSFAAGLAKQRLRCPLFGKELLVKPLIAEGGTHGRERCADALRAPR